MQQHSIMRHRIELLTYNKEQRPVTGIYYMYNPYEPIPIDEGGEWDMKGDLLRV